MRNSRNGWLCAAAVAAVLGAGLATASAQDQAPAGDPGAAQTEPGARAGRRGGIRERVSRWRRFRAKAMKARGEIAQALGFSDTQLRTMLDKARAAQPIAAEARKELARILVEARAQSGQASGQTADGSADAKAARKAARQAVKSKLKDLRTRTAAQLAPLARDVLATFTPEQRAKLEGFAAARGRKLDEDRLVKAIARRLARPMTADLLEARLGTR